MKSLLLVIITSLLYIIHSNHEHTKNTFTYINNDTYWRSLTSFTPINNASYGTIKLGRSVHMEFSFIYHKRNPLSYNTSIYENIFRIGYGDKTNDAQGAGSRYPSMWIYYKNNVYPHIEFSISDSKANWRKYPPAPSNTLFINKEKIYKCIVDFNETYVSINLSSHAPYQVIRPSGTATNILDDYMYIWISQFGHDGKASPVANITMFDIIIETYDHFITESPTTNPTLSPIVSIVSPNAIELYEFYNEPLNDEYKNKKDLYKSFIYNAIIMALRNITGYSMNMADNELYINKEWKYGGIHNINGNGMEFCMIFSEKLMDQIHVDCPLIPYPYNNEFEYVSVGLLYVEADINTESYREYIMDIMDLDRFHILFRKYLKQYVNDDQELFMIHEDNNGYLSNDIMNKIEIIGIIIIIICFIFCIIMIGCYSKKWYKIKDNNNINNNEAINNENTMCVIDRHIDTFIHENTNINRNYEKISMINNIYDDNDENVTSMESDENILKIYRKVTISRRKTDDKKFEMENGMSVIE